MKLSSVPSHCTVQPLIFVPHALPLSGVQRESMSSISALHLFTSKGPFYHTSAIHKTLSVNKPLTMMMCVLILVFTIERWSPSQASAQHRQSYHTKSTGKTHFQLETKKLDIAITFWNKWAIYLE